MNRRAKLAQWDIPFIAAGGVTLVARDRCAACIGRLLREGCDLFGYEGFTLFADGKYQPNLEWSASWSASAVPSAAEIVAQLEEAPPEVTHYEFVFRHDL
ncbi:hypothetical protein GCM10027034_14280 [Ramlibacter solisilvae]|uniref:Uncharacterized protein n=1 Tax=Ramlibacter tataouinensis TaxID=94132 RepID=A0A127JWT9_9BURK|nr:hypothetical protein [Ramlibacter tataouinensis]AMO24349.1 hypothetical protein UC35_17720 [Ramlibacter tataouinensis]